MTLVVTPLKVKGNKKWAHVEGDSIDELIALSRTLGKKIWSDGRGAFIEIDENEYYRLRQLYAEGYCNPPTLNKGKRG